MRTRKPVYHFPLCSNGLGSAYAGNRFDVLDMIGFCPSVDLELGAGAEENDFHHEVEEQRLLAIQDEIEKREFEQSECPHVKPNGYPAIGGIRDSYNNTHYICLRCQKVWVNENLPMHLRQNLNPIGGPVLS